MTTQTRNGLCPNPQSSIHLLGPGKRRRNETFICTSEIADSKRNIKGFQHLVESHLDYLLGVGPLCVFAEFPCGNGGAVDFLAINGAGFVFLVEVKRAKDQRAKFDVIFQMLKYHCFPAQILQELSERHLESKLAETLKLRPNVASSVSELAKRNIQERLMNPVVIVDEASYPLTHAYSLALRDIGGEIRVIEVNMQSVRAADDSKTMDLLYVRKYCSNDEWIGNECRNNRKPTEYISYEDKLSEIQDEKIRVMATRLLRDTGIKVPRAAKTMKCFAVVPDYAYFSFDPEGHICAGTYSRTAKPDNPYRVVAVNVETPDEQRLTAAGFRKVGSHNGKNSYLVFDLTPTSTDDELARLVTVLREFQRAKDAE